MTARNCPNCLRRTETDVIPPRTYGNVTTRAYEICCYCGWAYEEREESA